MAGTLAITSDTALKDISQKICGRRLIITGTADSSAATFPTLTLKKLNGFLQPVITNPGSTAPTDNYDITLAPSFDSTADISGGGLSNRDTSTTELGTVTLSGSATPAYLNGDYILAIANNSVNSAVVVITMDILAVTRS